jgi:Protein of unknown function (DUF4239)
MVEWLLYQLPTPLVALAVVVVFAGTSIGGFEVARRFLLPRIKHNDGVNDAISGALGAIGVLYGVTVGLVAIDAWQRSTEAEHIVAQEAMAIQELYTSVRREDRIGRRGQPVQSDGAAVLRDDNRDDSAKPAKLLVSEYLSELICSVWDAQKTGVLPDSDWKKLSKIRARIDAIEPEREGQRVRYAVALEALANLSELRRLRINAATDQLSGVMWTTVLIGAAITICLVYLFRLADLWLHRLIIGLLSSFLGFVLLMILVNDRPFLGKSGIGLEQYSRLGWIIPRPETLPSDVKWTDLVKQNRKQACNKIGYP